MRPALRVLATTLALAACTPDPTSTTAAASTAPDLGKADGWDAADRGCAIVLDHVERAGLSTIDGRSLAWEGELVLSDAGQAQGAPRVLYGVFGTWWDVPAEPVDGQPGRYRFRIEEHTIQTGVSTTSLTRFRMSLAPYLATADGGRVFDHNRLPGDFETYDLTTDNGWAIGADGTCVAPPAVGELDFGLGFTQRQEGALVAGGLVRVRYALDRLTTCHATRNGFPAYDVIAHARFLPGGEQASGGMRVTSTPPSGPTVSSRPFEARIPHGATAVELWFEHVGIGCQAFDSNLGQNYRFEVVSTRPAQVAWIGDVGGSFARDCVHRDGLADPTPISGYVMERACLWVDVDVYAPGAAAHPEWILGRVDYAIDGGAPRTQVLRDVGAVGDDRRLRWDVERGELARSPGWSTVTYTLRASTDGQTFVAVPPRTFVRAE